MIKLKTTRGIRKLLNDISHKVSYGTDEYMFLPFWFKKDSHGDYHIVKFEELSAELKELIKKSYEE